ncbi:TetR/AcrR family transcriptional regulator [Catenuloplanes atrovinosus]|uniref:AcrR family transcriptional regulator n=1 Tax=Catenuloplanes atrovinosus TaxID=137266 RepID=A0AAE3YL28_9ACTN|nr:helix-turn-helix domain-containing protein [Catenuloplanes atrovinosus]MDR7274314.1 AcrR family transcriptional regulator [Catenuloplanes atrovinosus]
MSTTRDRIVSAAAGVIRDRGLARATTKEIALAAGLSEAALYKHFRDKTDIFLAVLGERGPTTLVAVLGGLPGRVGAEPVADVLREVVLAAADFYEHGFPMAASLFSDPALFAAHLGRLRERNSGPQVPLAALAGYLEAERRLGRLRADADPDAAAAMLLGAAFQRAFLGNFTETGDPADFAGTVVATLLAGLEG